MVGSRTLFVMQDDGTEVPVVVTVEQPIAIDHHWECHFTIGWPEAPDRKYTGGEDALQALRLALNMITTLLYFSPYHEAGRLRWGRYGDGYGFPAARPIRDRLVGDDRYFDGDGPQDPRDFGQEP